MNIELLQEFLGWCIIINFGILTISTISLVLLKEKIAQLHAKTFGISSSEAKNHYFTYLANYKIAVIVFNLVPYLALLVIK